MRFSGIRWIHPKLRRLRMIAVVVASLLPFCVEGVAFGAERPNIVIILCDDLGYGDLGCYGHPQIKTPHIDRLSREGMLCTSYYAAAPVCSPSRAGLLSGKIPHRLGIVDWIPEGSPMHLHREERSLASLLKEAGYETCHVGKWHCNGHFNSPQQPQPNDHGFGHWFSTQNNSLPTHFNPVNFVRNGSATGPLTGYSSTIIVDEAVDWLNRSATASPFLLCVWFHAPHEVLATAPEFMKQYGDVQPAAKAEYFGNVTQMDHEVGRLLKRLDELNLTKHSLVLFTSDNGPEILNRYGPKSSRSYGSAAPLRGMKLQLYEGGIRVPGIVRWPEAITAGSKCEQPLSSLDLLTTCCKLAGIADENIPRNDGTDMLPALTGETLSRAQPLYWQYDRALEEPKFAIRVGAWKLLADAKLEKFELYHLAEDPGETRDLSSMEPDRVSELSRLLTEKYSDVQRDLAKLKVE